MERCFEPVIEKAKKQFLRLCFRYAAVVSFLAVIYWFVQTREIGRGADSVVLLFIVVIGLFGLLGVLSAWRKILRKDLVSYGTIRLTDDTVEFQERGLGRVVRLADICRIQVGSSGVTLYEKKSLGYERAVGLDTRFFSHEEICREIEDRLSAGGVGQDRSH